MDEEVTPLLGDDAGGHASDGLVRAEAGGEVRLPADRRERSIALEDADAVRRHRTAPRVEPRDLARPEWSPLVFERLRHDPEAEALVEGQGLVRVLRVDAEAGRGRPRVADRPEALGEERPREAAPPVLGLDRDRLGPADPRAVGIRVAHVAEDLAGDDIAVEGDAPERRVEGRLVEELVECRLGRRLLAVRVGEGSGVRVEDAAMHRPVRRIDRADLRAARGSAGPGSRRSRGG